MNATTTCRTGLEIVLEDPPESLRLRRFGLLMNQASVDRQWNYAHELLMARLGNSRLAAIFTPQHGLWGEQQANMCETPHSRDARRRIPIYSLYSESRRPTLEMLDGLELFVIDLQDVGTRIYTYIWTVVHCLQACAEKNIPVLLLDRPNPLGGVVVEGPLLDAAYTSFVGMLPIPMRHALTLGELARLCQRELHIQCHLEIVPLTGWRRPMLWPDCQLPWIPPSPNMPRFETAVVYPGQVLLEGTNLSEGRGTTTPFEYMGAPFIDPWSLLAAMPDTTRWGVTLRPVFFCPTFDKWQGERCGGVAWHWHDSSAVRSYAVTILLLQSIRRLWKDEFAWLPPPYEYEFRKPPIDILSGSAELRCTAPPAENLTHDHPQLEALLTVAEAAWWQRVSPILLYD